MNLIIKTDNNEFTIKVSASDVIADALKAHVGGVSVSVQLGGEDIDVNDTFESQCIEDGARLSVMAGASRPKFEAAGICNTHKHTRVAITPSVPQTDSMAR